MTEARIGAEKRLHQFTSFLLELAQLLLNGFDKTEWQEVNADVEGEAHVLQEVADVAIEGADGLQFR